ncbi:CHAT domain-containing protein [Streptomyces luteogriseus]|uniref:CHAT domain-containing protein n=1 Tax=Streptomyces luteogriseus TaxID=68233 RepID=UPI0036BB4FB3
MPSHDHQSVGDASSPRHRDQSKTFTSCPVCGVPVAVPSGLVREVNYPKDVSFIADICYGRFNSRAHRCGEIISFPVVVAVARQVSKEMIIVGELELPEDVRHTLDSEGWSASIISDYNVLRRCIFKWIEQDSAAFWPSIRDGRLWKMSLRDFVDKMSPIQLLSMKLARDRQLHMLVVPRNDPSAPPAPAADVEFLSDMDRLGTELTCLQLKRVVRLAIFDGRGGELEQAVTARVPHDCLDGQVLLRLAGEATSISPAKSPDDALQVHCLLVTCGVVHRLAGHLNPAIATLAQFLSELYELELRDDVQLDERFWLTPTQLRRLIDADSAFSAATTLARQEPGLPKMHSQLKAQAFLDRIGWPELTFGLTANLIEQETYELGEVDLASLTEPLIEGALEGRANGMDDWNLGRMVAGTAFRFLAISRKAPIDEKNWLNRLAESLAEKSSLITRLAFYTGTIEHANKAGRIDLAATAASVALNAYSTLNIGPEHALDVLVEAGNTSRYLRDWDQALLLYDDAKQASRLVPEGQPEREAVLARNRALVLRDAGRFGEAEAILTKQASDRPDDCAVQESLVLLYERVARRGEALALVEAQLARTDLTPYDTGRFLRLRALLKAWLAEHDEAAADCLAAIQLHGDNHWERLQTETCALQTHPVNERLAAFVADCERHAMESLDGPLDLNVATTTATLAALRQLRTRQVVPAGELIEKISDRLGSIKAKGSWQFELALGWHAMETGAPGAFDHFTKAVAELDTRLPMAEEADYAMGTLASFAIEDLQRLAARAGVAAVGADQHAPAALIAVLDVANGRDLTARASAGAEIPNAGSATVDALDRWQATAHADVAAFIDDTPTLHLLLQPAGGNRRLVDTAIPVSELTTATHALRKFDLINPLAPDRMDTGLAPWWEVASTIASILRRELPGGRELVLVPGRLLVATPLHAAGWPEDPPLIADRPVSVTPNHRLLAGQHRGNPAEGTASYGLIAAPKVTDTTAFTEKLMSFIQQFCDRAPQAQVISMTEADEAASLAVLGESDVAFALCHGVHGGPTLGPGICVAADGMLPPSHLDLAGDPDLGDFVVSWDDVVKLPHSPGLLVSIACSSGRTVVGSGGSRLGLEQGTLANATRFVVAPLWPVEQQSSLAWVEAFLEPMDLVAAGRLSLQGVPEWHRAATLALAERGSHPYHWAPFALTTALRGGTS